MVVRFDDNPTYGGIYVITNRHVVQTAKTPVVRLNRKDGATKYLETEERQWKMHDDGDDVAVLPFEMSFEDLRISAISVDQFLTPQLIADEDIGIGDDVFMVGRFVNHEGKQRNNPAIRFGNIAMMPEEKIELPYGITQEAFLVEVRSLPGYSGSPVFLYSSAVNDMSMRRFGHDLPDSVPEIGDPGWDIYLNRVRAKGPYLLGIDCCHLHNRSIVRDRDERPISEGWYIMENTGMAGVVPAWKIADVLNCEEFIQMRKKQDKEVTQQKKECGTTLDTATEPEMFTKDDFTNALKRASRRVPPLRSGKEKK